MIIAPLVLVSVIAAGPPDLVAAALRSLASGDVAARVWAASILGRVGPPGDDLAGEDDLAVAALLRASGRDADEDVREGAMSALCRVTRATPTILRHFGEALRDGPAGRRREAALHLHRASADVMPALRVALSGPGPHTSDWPLLIARRVGPRAVPLLPALVLALQDPDADTRLSAAFAVLHVAPGVATDRVDSLIADYARNSVTVLSCLSPPDHDFGRHSDLPRTIAALVAEAGKGEVLRQEMALEILWQFGPRLKPHAAALRKHLASPHIHVRFRAAKALVLAGDVAPAVAAAARELDADDPTGDWLIFASQAGPAARDLIPLLRRHARGEDAGMRQLAANAIWHVGMRREGLASLTRLADGPDKGMRPFAARALGRIGPPAAVAVPAILRGLREDPAHFRASVPALASIGPAAADAEPALRSALKHPEEWFRIHAAAALLKIRPGHAAALDALRDVAHRDPELLPHALRVIADAGPAAHVAAAWVRRLLRHPEDGRFASTALWKIDPDAARKAGAW